MMYAGNVFNCVNIFLFTPHSKHGTSSETEGQRERARGRGPEGEGEVLYMRKGGLQLDMVCGQLSISHTPRHAGLSPYTIPALVKTHATHSLSLSLSLSQL